MATYKAVNVDQLDADMTALANTIRTKGGTSGELAWPEGYQAAVNAIETGGGNEVLDALIARRITEISSEVDNVGGHAFRDCMSLISARFPKAGRVGISSFEGCTYLSEAYFPSAINVSSYAFSGCYRLEIVDLHEVTSISNRVFNNCYSLVSLILRTSSVCALGNADAFTKCYHILGTVNATYNPDGKKDGYIYVPSALVDSYKAATNWSTYADQIRALESYTVDGTTTGELDPNKTGT